MHSHVVRSSFLDAGNRVKRLSTRGIVNHVGFVYGVVAFTRRGYLGTAVAAPPTYRVEQVPCEAHPSSDPCPVQLNGKCAEQEYPNASGFG